MSNFTNLSIKTNISGLSTSNGSDVEIKCKAFSTNVIASKKIALITLFGGIGHNYTYSNLDVDSDIILGNSLSINTNDILTTKYGKMHENMESALLEGYSRIHIDQYYYSLPHARAREILGLEYDSHARA